jgi:hypothetical protein
MLDHEANGRHGDWYTIEHLNRFPPYNDPTTVSFCCWSCNSSRGDKLLIDWFKTPYCQSRNINAATVTEPVRIYLATARDELMAQETQEQRDARGELTPDDLIIEQPDGTVLYPADIKRLMRQRQAAAEPPAPQPKPLPLGGARPLSPKGGAG